MAWKTKHEDIKSETYNWVIWQVELAEQSHLIMGL